jgi:hypothetical protein
VTFRSAYRADLPLRAVDLGLHVVAAVLLPGPWWCQWLPDAVLPLLWLRGMAINEFDTDASSLLRLHRGLHLRGLCWPLGVLFCACGGLVLGPWLVAQWATHAVIDLFTHRGEWA